MLGAGNDSLPKLWGGRPGDAFSASLPSRPPACRVAWLQRTYGDAPHQDRCDACGEFLREMRWSRLEPVMPGPASRSRSLLTIATGKSKRFGEPLARPGSVRHMSVTIVVQQRLLTDDDRG